MRFIKEYVIPGLLWVLCGGTLYFILTMLAVHLDIDWV